MSGGREGETGRVDRIRSRARALSSVFSLSLSVCLSRSPFLLLCLSRARCNKFEF